MNELVTRSLQEHNTRFVAEFPRELLTDEIREMFTWILNFERKYEKTPSVKALMEEFEYFVPYRFTATTWEDDPPPLETVYDRAVKEQLFNISERKLRDVEAIMHREGEVPLELLREIEQMHTMSLGASRYSTFDRSLYFRRKAMDIPFKLVNKHIGGLSNGDFMLIVGRLGTGKSTVTQHFAAYSWELEKRVLYVSAETLDLDVFARIDAMIGKFNPLDLRGGKTPRLESILEGVSYKAREAKGEIIVPKTRLLSPAQIGSFARTAQADILMVDGAYLLMPSTGRFGSRWEQVSAVSNELKQIALDLKIPLIATAQIKRGASGADGYDPEDIALSDSLGQDADFVGAIYQNKTMPERAEFQLIKNRYGSPVSTQFSVDYDTMTIVDETVDGAAGVEPGKRFSIKEWIDED